MDDDDELYEKVPYLELLNHANEIGLLGSVDFNIPTEKLEEYIKLYQEGDDYVKYYLKCLLAYEYKYEIEIPNINLPEIYLTIFNDKYRYHNSNSYVNIGKYKFNIGYSEKSITIPELQRELSRLGITYNIFEDKKSLYLRLIKNVEKVFEIN